MEATTSEKRVGYMVRCVDGPAQGDHQVGDLGWPLPEFVLGTEMQVLMQGWLFIGAGQLKAGAEERMIDDVTKRPDAVYEKISESELGEDVPGVMRGAQYRLVDEIPHPELD